MTYQPTKWCQNCAAPYPAHLDGCPECQWQATVKDAARVLDKHGFKPTPEPSSDDALWDAMEGRR